MKTDSNHINPETNESEVSQLAYSTVLSRERVRELLDYDPEAGRFFWRNTNKPAGTLRSDGYVYITIGGSHYNAGSIAYLYVYGVWTLVDHKDRCRWNNALYNLRKTTKSQNNQNRCVQSNNILGVKGVRQRGRRYEVRIRVHGKLINLGRYSTIEQASDVYKHAAIRYFGEFANVEG